MSCRKLTLFVLATICAGACGSPPPSAVDEELLFVDVTACARKDASCEQSGSTGTAELLLPGDHGLMIYAKPVCGAAECENWTQVCCASSTTCEKIGTCTGPTIKPVPATVTLPILEHTPDARLAWIAIGLVAGGNTRTLRVKIEGQEETIVQPSAGWARVEVSGRDKTVPAGARLELVAEDGIFGVAWIVGRWKR